MGKKVYNFFELKMANQREMNEGNCQISFEEVNPKQMVGKKGVDIQIREKNKKRNGIDSKITQLRKYTFTPKEFPLEIVTLQQQQLTKKNQVLENRNKNQRTVQEITSSCCLMLNFEDFFPHYCLARKTGNSPKKKSSDL